MLEPTENSFYELKPHIVLHKNSSDHYWVFNTEDGSHYSLNYTAYWIVKKLTSGSHAFSEILGDYLDTFEVDQELSRNDLDEIICSLEREGIILRRV